MTQLDKILPTMHDALAYLDAFVNYERVSDYKIGPNALGTERIQELLTRLEQPHMAAPVLHVAGTKGKGSIAYLTARLLMARGYRTGLFVSPHIENVRERIQIDGVPISEEAFCEAFAVVQPAVEAMRAHPRLKPPTYFETLTALAFVAFRNATVDALVLEVGMGGRLDATNVHGLPVVASAIATISKDHTKQLGDDLVSIAGEKAAILRENTTAVFAPQEALVLAFLQECARTLHIPVRLAGRDVAVTLREPPSVNAPEAPQRLDITTWRAVHHDVPLPLMGAHQRDNAAVALGLAERFLEWDNTGPLDTASIRTAWRSAQIPGRLEIVRRAPWVVLDGAHNAASAWALAEAVVERFRNVKPRALVFAVNRDKDVAAMLRILAPLFGRIFITLNGSPRCMEPVKVRLAVPEEYRANASVEPDASQAVRLASQEAGAEGMVVVAGSLYLVGLLRGELIQ